MISTRVDPLTVEIHESVGLPHEAQVIEISLPEDGPALLWMVDRESGRRFPVQRSRRDPSLGFMLLSVAAFESLSLVPEAERSYAEEIKTPTLALSPFPGSCILTNGILSLECPLGHEDVDVQAQLRRMQGPVLRVRSSTGPWRGATYFDLTVPVTDRVGEILEEGPVRLVYRFRLLSGDVRAYQVEITLDAGQELAAFCEEFDAGPAGQIVWDFSGDDLPMQIDLLDSGAGYTSRPLYYHFDHRLARLAAWTQYDHALDLADGYALRFGGAIDVVGFVTRAAAAAGPTGRG
jgi:hypothetical protein